MHRAIELAKLGTGWTNPNPLVGAVIVKNGKIIGEGYHHKYGELHAERDALKNCAQNNENSFGATMYVTLEPCCHTGKQPPCTQAILESGIKKVFVGSRDPNPLVSGKGVQFLKENNIEVEIDFLKDECDKINPIFFHYITKKMPYVALKFAMTIDGKIATKTGKSKWITGEKSREFVHELRHSYSAILAGIGTVLADDPMLNCRAEQIENTKNPVRIILDSNLKIPLESKIVQTASEIRTIVVCLTSASNDYKAKLKEKKVEIWEFSSSPLPIDKILERLAQQEKIDSVLVEGGSTINWSFVESGFVNKIYCFVAPKIFGGNGKSSVLGCGIENPIDAKEFELNSTRIFDSDILLEYVAKKC